MTNKSWAITLEQSETIIPPKVLNIRYDRHSKYKAAGKQQQLINMQFRCYGHWLCKDLQSLLTQTSFLYNRVVYLTLFIPIGSEFLLVQYLLSYRTLPLIVLLDKRVLKDVLNKLPRSQALSSLPWSWSSNSFFFTWPLGSVTLANSDFFLCPLLRWYEMPRIVTRQSQLSVLQNYD